MAHKINGLSIDAAPTPVPISEAPDCKLVDVIAAGFARPVPGVVYRSGALGRGLPLGAIGTGYLELMGDGRLGDTTIFNHFPAAYTFEQPPRFERPLFALSMGGETIVLATRRDGSDEAAQLGDARYAADVAYWGHYPFADLAYDVGGPVDVQLRAWTPFVPGDAVASNIPVAVFELELANHAGEAVDVVAALAFPGYDVAPGKDHRHDKLADGSGVFVSTELHGTRAGYALQVSGAGEVTSGAMLGTSEHPWSALSATLPTDASGEAGGTVAAQVRLDAGERRTLTFMISWCYPSFQVGGAFPYTHMYASRFTDAADVGSQVTDRLDELRRRSLAWQDAVYRQDLPAWLRDGLVNSLYCVAKNSWWIRHEDGADDPWGASGSFTMNETFRDCPVTETVPCRFFGHYPILLLFPELEESTLRALAHYQLKSGEIPFALAFGSGLHDPRYHCVHPLVSGMFVQMLLRYHLRTGDKTLVTELLSAVKDAVGFLQSLDGDADGLVNEHPHALPGTLWPANNYHDAFPWYGTSIYTSGVWLATLQAAAELARLAGDTEYAAQCDSWLIDGQQALDRQLWAGDRYVVYRDPAGGREVDASLLNQLIGEWCSRQNGLPSVLPDAKVKITIETVLRENVERGAIAPIDTVTRDGRPYQVIDSDDPAQHQASSCMVSEAICFAMTLMWRGRLDEGMAIAERIWDAHAIRHRTPFDQYYLIEPDDGSPVWGNDYYSNLITWAIPMALAQHDVARFAAGPLITECLRTGAATSRT